MNAPVPIAPVERIFKRLAATYGAAWDRAMGQAPLVDVMTTWDHELSGFLRSRQAMQAIAWALEHLPERCLNVMEFKSLCRMAPAVMQPALPAPAADAERVSQEFANLAHLREPNFVTDHKDWARAIVAKKTAGERVNPTSLRMARDALGLGIELHRQQSTAKS